MNDNVVDLAQIIFLFYQPLSVEKAKCGHPGGAMGGADLWIFCTLNF